MKILITGATGFIGSNLIEKLFNEGNNLFCTLQPNEIPTGIENFIETHILSESEIISLIKFIEDNQIEGVIHLASFVQSVNHSASDVEKIIDSNVKFSTKVLEASCQAGVKWFINTGTYWQHYNNLEYSPVNLYAATKQAFQNIAQFYIDTNRIKFCTLKLYDTYGANDSRPKIFNLWEKIAFTGESLEMSPGDQIIDISYIDDIVNAFNLLAKHLSNFDNCSPMIENGSIYAVKAQRRYTLKELSEKFEKISNTRLNIKWGAKSYRDREVMVPWDNCDVVPGWISEVSIEKGIKLFLDRLNENKTE